jgi:hypothetical protein
MVNDTPKDLCVENMSTLLENMGTFKACRNLTFRCNGLHGDQQCFHNAHNEHNEHNEHQQTSFAVVHATS